MVMRFAAVMHRPWLLGSALLALAVLALLLTLAILQVVAVSAPVLPVTMPAVTDPIPVIVVPEPAPVPVPAPNSGGAYEGATHTQGVFDALPGVGAADGADPESGAGMTGQLP